VAPLIIALTVFVGFPVALLAIGFLLGFTKGPNDDDPLR
jgi:hypothetical protein